MMEWADWALLVSVVALLVSLGGFFYWERW